MLLVICAALSGGIWGAHYSDRRSGRGRNGNMFRIKDVAKTIISGQMLEKPTIYMCDLPPKLIMDLLYVINVHCSTFKEKYTKLAVFCLIDFCPIYIWTKTTIW